MTINYSILDFWPNYYIPQEIKDTFITLGPKPSLIDITVKDK